MPSCESCSTRWRMRSASSPAALRVKVSPRISPGFTCPLASSQSTRPAIVSVLPLPAPATTRAGDRSASMTARCCSVGRNMPSASAISLAPMVARNTASSVTASITALCSITAHCPHPVQHPCCRVESAPGVQIGDAGEFRGSHCHRGLPDAPPESFQLLIIEAGLHAFAVALAPDTLLHVEEFRAAAVVLPEFVEEWVEHSLRVGELVGAELRMLVDGILFGDRRPGLQVDDDDGPVRRTLDAVDRAVDLGRADLQLESPLRADEGLAIALEVAEIFGDAAGQDPRRPLLLFTDPGGLEEQFVPAALDLLPDGVDAGVGGVLHRPVHDRADAHGRAALGAGHRVDE